MAKVTNVNIDCTTNRGAQAFFDLKVFLTTSCGYTLIATGNGTAGAGNCSNAPIPPNTDFVSTLAAFNTANAYYVLADPSGKFWIAVQRGSVNTAFNIRMYVGVVPPTAVSGSVIPTLAITANQVDILTTGFSFGSGANRAHLISYNSAENLAGIRPVYLLMTDSSATIVSTFLVEAAADGTYSTNANPWAATASTAGLSTGSVWQYFHSPTSVFAPVTGVAGVNNTGIDPFTGADQGLPMSLGRSFSAAQPGFWGTFKNLRFRTTQRGYPDTMTTAGGDRFVYANNSVVPYADGVNPQ
jgi:hypothetical protein